MVDDRRMNYVELQTENESLAEANAAVGMLSMMTGSLSSGCAYGNPVYFTNMTAVVDSLGATTASFDIAGGTNMVPYDILKTTNVPATNSNWIGIGYKDNHYSFANHPFDQSFYVLARPTNTMTVGIGNNSFNQCAIPSNLTNVVQVAAGGRHSLALRADGIVVAWGDNLYGKCNVPTTLSGVSQVAAGWYHSVALQSNGNVVAWGAYDPTIHWCFTNVPPSLTNAIAISAQAMHSLALKKDGTVVSWGYDSGSGETNVPSTVYNVIAISAGYQHNLAVKADGKVVAWGNNNHHQCDVPPDLANVVDVAAGTFHSLALKADGKVVAWGWNSPAGETIVPDGLTNVVAIAASGDPWYTNLNLAYSMALRSDGKVIGWGYDEVVDHANGLNNIISLGAGSDHALVVRTGPQTPVITFPPTDQYQVAGGSVTFTSACYVPFGLTYQWRKNGANITGATGSTYTLANVQATDEAVYSVVISNSTGYTISPNAFFHLVRTPVIISQSPTPTTQTITYQNLTTLSATAASEGQNNGFSLSYQWKFNNVDITGATSNIYTFRPEQSGTYSVLVSNAAGSAIASWQITISYANTYVDVGTLAYHLSTNAVGYASGHTPSDELQLSNWTYGFYSGSTMGLLTNAMWNPNCWLYGVKGLSATSIGISNNIIEPYSYNGAALMITMVSPRHYLRATHTKTPPGIIAFLDTKYWRGQHHIGGKGAGRVIWASE